MSKPIIAVDVDDVLSASVPGFTAYSNKRWDLNLTVDQYDEDWAKFWGIPYEEALARAAELHESDMFGSFAHFEEALPVLKKLKEKYDLIVLTSRRLSIKPATTEWIDRHFSGIFSAVHFAGFYDDTKNLHESLKKTKGDLCRQLGADYLVDDQPKHCLAASTCGVQSLLFGNYGWNKIAADEAEAKNITIVHTWDDVARYFDAKS